MGAGPTIAVPPTVRLVKLDVITFSETTLRVERFELPVIFREDPKTETVLRVVMLVVERFEDPETFSPVRIPTDVMFGWAGWETTRATLAFATFPTKLEEFRFERPEAFPMYSRAVTVERFEVPVTFKFVPKIESAFREEVLHTDRFEVPETLSPVRTPTDVILGWAGFVTLEATLAAATLPIRFDEFRLESPEAFGAMSNPLTVRLVRVPTDVIFG